MAEMVFNELPVKRVTVQATVTFEAYVACDDNGTVRTGRIAYEIADAIEYHAVHLENTEDADGLVALVGGGSGDAATVEIDSCDVVECEDTSADVENAVGASAAWI